LIERKIIMRANSSWRLLLKLTICAGMTLAAGVPLAAEEPATGFVSRVFHDEAGEHKYTVFLPAAYRADQKWPVLLYLHGAGSRGTDGKLPLIGGIGPQIAARAKTLAMIVVFPQCEDVDGRPAVGWRADGPDAKRALAILDEVEREFSIDTKREILSGASMGGFGTWNVAAATPSRWAAIVPLAGAGDLSKARNLKNMPIWAFHGSKDLEVKPQDHKQMVDAVREAGGRAYFTLLPEVRHNILSVVFGDDAVYEWMLNPRSEPRPESIVQAAKAPLKKTDIDPDFFQAFVPGVEVPQAIYVHLDPEAIEALCYALPEMVPAEALSANAPDIYQSRQGIMSRFRITLAGINYRGTLERAIVSTKDDGWITITLGIRNMIAEIGSTSVRGPLMSATAGPMDIVVGRARPVWLAFDVRPTVANRKVKFEIGSRHFEIPNDNYYVTTPQVGVGTPMPFIRRRIAGTVSSQLVEGAYGRKTEIEQRVVDAVPGLVARLEQGLEKSLIRTRELGGWPMPATQPRYRLWVDSLHVDRGGIAMILGTVFAQPGLNPTSRPLRRVERPIVKVETLAGGRGFTLGFSGAVAEGLTQTVVDSGAAVMNADEMSVKEFGAFGDVAQISKAVPDILRYGDGLQIRTRFRAVEPVLCNAVERPTSDGKETLDNASGEKDKRCLVQLGLPHFVLSVEIKTLPRQAQWQSCAEFDLRAVQELKLGVRAPAFSERTFTLKKASPEEIDVKGHFADGYMPQNPTLHPEVIRELLRTAWNAAGKLDLVDEVAMKDRLIGSANLRLSDVETIGPFIALRYQPARTRITNGTSDPIVYEVRGPQSTWGGPFTLKPNESSDFPVPYPVTIRRTIANKEEVQTLPMGSDFVFGRVMNAEADPTNVATQPGAQTSRN
jgi:poly(3-hydroxybutyrate) depolymerase